MSKRYALTQDMRNVFNTQKSEDDFQREIEKLTSNYNVPQKIAIWLSIFRQSDTLGKAFNNAPRIRGRAGEMLALYVVKKLQEDMPELQYSKVYHSFHYQGTEQDILFVTEKCVYLIEIKSQKAADASKMFTGAGSSGVTQNEMHIERFDAFLKKRLRYVHPIPFEPYLVYAVSNVRSKTKTKGTTVMLPVQRLYKQLFTSIRVVNAKAEVRDYDYLVHQLDEYIKSGEEKTSHNDHKRRLGYE